MKQEGNCRGIVEKVALFSLYFINLFSSETGDRKWQSGEVGFDMEIRMTKYMQRQIACECGICGGYWQSWRSCCFITKIQYFKVLSVHPKQ